MTIGQRIRKYRKAKKLSQKDLAERLNVYQTHISKWEKDEFAPGAESVAALAKALGVSIADLYDDRPPGQAGVKQVGNVDSSHKFYDYMRDAWKDVLPELVQLDVELRKKGISWHDVVALVRQYSGQPEEYRRAMNTLLGVTPQQQKRQSGR
jgi:transcriptional regulator with XRE-family HTH domain